MIDQTIVYLGGLDVCYGRWDLSSHPLVDLSNDPNEKQLFPGQDYFNERRANMENDDDYKKCSIDREKQVRMPWHDVGIRIEGEVTLDYSHHFVHLWNNAKIDKLGRRGKHLESSLTTKSR